MTESLTETIANIEYDNLIYSSDVDLITSGVVVASGQGELTRGTCLAVNSDNQMVILGTDGAEADCILCDDIDATDADVNTTAYVSGHFNEDALIVLDGYTITDSDKAVLRTKNILIGTSQEY